LRIIRCSLLHFATFLSYENNRQVSIIHSFTQNNPRLLLKIPRNLKNRPTEITMTLRTRHPFLDKLGVATTKKDCGLYLFKGFLSPKEAKAAFDVLVDDAKFPWDTKPELNGKPLTHQSCEHELLESAKEQKKKRGMIKYTSNLKGLLKLGELTARIERDFDVKVSFVFCNRFPSPDHILDWHKNAYREHICVLTLGSKRRVEFRNNKTKKIETMTPSCGDLYMMPLNLNDTHTHRVCSANETDPNESNSDVFLSFIFFFKAPKYAKDFFKIPKKDKMMGFLKGRPSMKININNS
jgi:hypothetical protein